MKSFLFVAISAVTSLSAMSAEAALPPFEQSRKEIDAVLDLMTKQNLADGEIRSIAKTIRGYMVIAGSCEMTADVTSAPPPPDGSAGPGDVRAKLTGFNCASDRGGERGPGDGRGDDDHGRGDNDHGRGDNDHGRGDEGGGRQPPPPQPPSQPEPPPTSNAKVW